MVLRHRNAEPCRIVRFSRSINDVFSVDESSDRCSLSSNRLSVPTTALRSTFTMRPKTLCASWGRFFLKFLIDPRRGGSYPPPQCPSLPPQEVDGFACASQTGRSGRRKRSRDFVRTAARATVARPTPLSSRYPERREVTPGCRQHSTVPPVRRPRTKRGLKPKTSVWLA